MVKIKALSALVVLIVSACAINQVSPEIESGPPKDSSVVLFPTALPVEATATDPSGFGVITATELALTAPAAFLPHPEDICQNPYFPVVPGASWSYQGPLDEKTTHGFQDVHDKIFTMVVKSPGSTFTIDGQCTEEGIILMDVPGISATSTSETGGSSLTTTNQEGVTLPNDLTVGDEWSQTIQVIGHSDGEVTLSATILTNYRAIGFEIVTVPAGTFEAVKIEQSGTMVLGGTPISTHGFLWYAQGVGNVLAEQAMAGESRYRIELVSFSLP